jgi:acetoin utilization deacetylase AcuC-like enzyme
MLLTANGYGSLTAKLMKVAAEVCDGRILMTHEGGYSAVYAPFCGQAVLQELSQVKLLADPFAHVDNYPAQTLTRDQATEIELAAKLVDLIP